MLFVILFHRQEREPEIRIQEPKRTPVCNSLGCNASSSENWACEIADLQMALRPVGCVLKKKITVAMAMELTQYGLKLDGLLVAFLWSLKESKQCCTNAFGEFNLVGWEHLKSLGLAAAQPRGHLPTTSI